MNDKDTVVVSRAVVDRVIRLADTLASDVPITSSARKHITDAYAALAAAPSTSVREEVSAIVVNLYSEMAASPVDDVTVITRDQLDALAALVPSTDEGKRP